MHAALGWKIWLLVALGVCLGISGLRISQGEDFVAALKGSLSITSILVTGFVTTPAWRILWVLPYFRKRAPPIDGEWAGVVRSNWSVIQRLKAAAKQDGAPALDVDDMTVEMPELAEVAVRARIRTSFAAIHMDLETADDSYQASKLKVVELRPASDAGDATLTYVFEGRVPNPRPGDVAVFDGAATVCIRALDDGVLTMDGETWTNRGWRRGLNTAGLIKLTRTKAMFRAKATFGLWK